MSAKDKDALRYKDLQRNERKSNVSYLARVPTQERSRLRYQAILDATEALLWSYNIEDISLYDIATQANLAPASVHYLFRTVAAVHVEMNKMYNDRLTQKMIERQAVLVVAKAPSWQDWVSTTMAEARTILNSCRPMCEIMLGPALHRKSRAMNLITNASFAQTSLLEMQRSFLMPQIPNLERHYLFATEIGEALWTGSYTVRKTIGEETFNESVRATIAYLRCFLPEVLVLRDDCPDDLSPL